MEWSLFCDESGNTGPDYINDQQPFCAAAGILVRDADLFALEAIVASITGPGMAFKGTRLLGSSPGRRAVWSLFSRLETLPAYSFYMVFEKRLALAGRVLDLLCDPDSNPIAAWLPMTAKERRKDLSEVLLDQVDWHTFSEFAAGYRDMDVPRLSDAVSGMAKALSSAGDCAVLRQTLDYAASDMTAIVRSEARNQSPTRVRLLGSLNLPAYNHMVVAADRFVDGRGRMSVVHDRINGYDEEIRVFTGLMSGVASNWITEGGRRMTTGLANVIGFRVSSGGDVPALRAADCLASCVTKVFREVSSGVQWSGTARDLARYVMKRVAPAEPVFGFADVSRRTHACFRRAWANVGHR